MARKPPNVSNESHVQTPIQDEQNAAEDVGPFSCHAHPVNRIRALLTTALWASLALPVIAEAPITETWDDFAIVSSTMGANQGRLCVGADRGDLGCPTYAPSLTTAGDVSVTGNLSASKFIGDGSGLTNISVSSTGAGLTSTTLSGNITLTYGVDNPIQLLKPGGSDRTITLSTSGATAGNTFEIINNDTYNNAYALIVRNSIGEISRLYARDSERFVFSGTNWQSVEHGGDGNANTYGNTVFGSASVAYNYGAAFGRNAQASIWGAAMGAQSNAASYGAAVGANAAGSTYGTAIGSGAYGSYYSVAVGYNAGNGDTTSPMTSGNGNLLLGYKAGYSPATSLNLSNTLVITNDNWDVKRPLIYGRFDTARLGIGTTTPSTTLSISGSLLLAGDSGQVCNDTTIGIIRRNPTTGRLQVCK